MPGERAEHIDNKDYAARRVAVKNLMRPRIIEHHGLAFTPDILLSIDNKCGRIVARNLYAQMIAQVAEIGSLVNWHVFAGVQDREESLDEGRYSVEKHACFRAQAPVMSRFI